ncbi:toxin-activating lysine-acyltransferase [Phaeobacter sp. B1627]|uniref:toxin-activating lysine-acyltransferase n=1 Tax=Phaeobacter sp. B1627 TaxID=2583809 RepID=UPI001118C190|nr:toxin-activating lysine-acyltransferase [Phaeobacter sp. B1627]TNJ38535.1 toxin-activating lysine-acyltransferase [Phaeobacter sp. B1627]
MIHETAKQAGDSNPDEKLDPHTFASTFGQAVWLMTMSKAYQDLHIRDLEHRVAPAVLLRHFKLYSKGKQPVAFLTWASVTDELRDRIAAGDKTLELQDWRSGRNIVVVDCVSPFAPASEIIEGFLNAVPSA